MMKISAIVPVYCEEKTVGRVVKTLLASPLIDEVICVDDGSEDASLKVLRGFSGKIVLIKHKKNKGKGAALVSGIKKAKGEIVSFFDADIANLTDKHIETLLAPILKGRARAIIGYGSIKYRGFAKWTGERAYYKKDLLPHLKKMHGARFGVEMYLNHVFKDSKTVLLRGMKTLYKNGKFGSQKLVKEYIKEVVEVAKTKSQLYGGSFSAEFGALTRAKTIEEFRLRLSKIADKEFKRFVKQYILKYIPL